MTTPALPTAGVQDGDPVTPGTTEPSGGRGWTIAFLLAAFATVVALPWLGRSTTFFADAWKFIDERLGWDVAAFLAPHWEHPVPLTALAWKILFETVGLASITPYLLLVSVAHALLAGAVFRIVRRSAGPATAFGAALLLLLLGTGGEALLVANSFNQVAASAAGAWALAVFLEAPGRRGRVAVALLLLLAIGFSGSGLFYLAAIAATALVLPGRAREALLVLPAGIAYVAWQMAWGSGSLASRASGALDALRSYLEAGIGHAVGALVGLGDAIGLVLAVLLVLATAWHLLGRRPVLGGAVAGTVGLVSVFLVTGLARTEALTPGGDSPAEASRYVYLAAPFILVAGGAWLSRRPRITLRDARSALPLVAVLAVAIAGNAWQLIGWRDQVDGFSTEARAAITVLARYGGSPALPADRPATPPAGSFLAQLPAPERLRAILDRYGDPAAGVAVPPAEIERVLMGYMDPLVVPATLASVPALTAAPRVIDGAGGATVVDGCVAVPGTGQPSPVVLAAPGGSTLVLAGDAPITLTASLSADGSFAAPVSRSLALGSGAVAALPLPDLATDRPWQIRVVAATPGPWRACLADA